MKSVDLRTQTKNTRAILYEPVEFVKYPVEFNTSGNLPIISEESTEYSKLNKKKCKRSQLSCNWLILIDYAQNSSQTLAWR